MPKYTIDQQTLKANYESAARNLFNKELKALNPYELNSVIAHVVKKKVISPNWEKSKNLYSDKRIAIYFSIEFLIGRVVLDVLTNTGLKEVTTKIFAEEGIDINCLEEVDDTALGNGGLGRLAACFVESAATMGYPLFGVGLYYKYGLFKQQFDESGHQIEVPDDWTRNGESWFEPQYDEAVIVEYQDTKVKAVPYVMPVIGYNSSKETCESNAFPLILWKAEPIEGVTNESAARISDYLYPNDGDDEGKKLRIRQEYFFVSAMLQRIFKIHLEKHGNLDNIEDYYMFQMNDTHPVMGCLEFIRLLKLNGYSFEEASKKAKKCFAYTNHTVLSEALEKWSRNIFREVVPEMYKIIEELNQELIDWLPNISEFCITETENGHIKRNANWEKIKEYELFSEEFINQSGQVDKTIYMSNIACYVANKINGVAAVHTEIIKKDLLSRWYRIFPYKFVNKTNGVTPRRWLKFSNPELAELLDYYVGENWLNNMTLLENLEKYKNDQNVLSEFATVKKKAKIKLADYIQKHEGIQIDPDSIFDCQVKRIHEYKRQVMNALRILYIYDQLKQGNFKNFYKTTFIIGGKAAASYERAKSTITLIKNIQEMINNDPEVNDKIKVVFITNFNVSYGEKIYAGANFSEQISMAGKEASGTGNMKFMMNGAPTIGTLDGANIEIVEEAGTKNNYIFGATVEEFKRMLPMYKHQDFLRINKDLASLIDYLTGKRNLKGTYYDLAKILREEDTYFNMYDLRAYIDATIKANQDYANEQETGDLNFYTRKSLKNIAHSGKFSSDRTIYEYCTDIWHIEKIE